MKVIRFGVILSEVNSKKILVDMLEKAIDSDLLVKNAAKQINTVITKENKKERRVLSRKEIEIFLAEAEYTFYYNLFIAALETGMRVGVLAGLLRRIKGCVIFL